MKGFFAGLTEEQKAKALAYRGDENHGDPAFAYNASEMGRRFGGHCIHGVSLGWHCDACAIENAPSKT